MRPRSCSKDQQQILAALARRRSSGTCACRRLDEARALGGKCALRQLGCMSIRSESELADRPASRVPEAGLASWSLCFRIGSRAAQGEK